MKHRVVCPFAGSVSLRIAPGLQRSNALSLTCSLTCFIQSAIIRSQFRSL
jgi:hypothetical protein